MRVSGTSLVPDGYVECHVCKGTCATYANSVCQCCNGQGMITIERQGVLSQIGADIRARYEVMNPGSLGDMPPKAFWPGYPPPTKET